MNKLALLLAVGYLLFALRGVSANGPSTPGPENPVSPEPLAQRAPLAQQEPLAGQEVLAAPQAFAAQSSGLFYDEARTVYLTNLERRANGKPPLRWNRELTLTTRWFAWDSVENRRPGGYCGHTDTLGRAPWDRSPVFGYGGWGGGEIAICGLTTPEGAVQGWIDSPPHHEIMLDVDYWESGVGFYRSPADGRGYVAQQFGKEDLYPPLIVQNEAPNTTSTAVSLYRHSPQGAGGIQSMGAAEEMMVSNNQSFSGATWTPYSPEVGWQLAPGSGWRTVYSKIRDKLGRTSQACDTIYLGGSLPIQELDLAYLSSTSNSVTLYQLNPGRYGKMQFSLGWVADDGDGSFNQWWGNPGGPVSDAAAIGRTAYRFPGGEAEAMAWVVTNSFIPDADMVAYFRLKVSDNTTTAQVARVQVIANEASAGEVALRGVDFKAANQYQEFAVPFRYSNNSAKPWLEFRIMRSGSADVTFDAVTIFTAGVAASGQYTWAVPGGRYRGQGVWVRYANSTTDFSGYQEAAIALDAFTASPGRVTLLALPGQPSAARTVQAVRTCGTAGFQVSDNAAWLDSQVNGSGQVSLRAAGMPLGTHSAVVTISSDGMTAQVPVTLVVVERIYETYLPALSK